MQVNYPDQLDFFPDGRTKEDWNNGNPGFGIGPIELELILSALETIVGANDLQDKTSLQYRLIQAETIISQLSLVISALSALVNQDVKTTASPTFVDVNATGVLKVDGTQVVGNQQSNWQPMGGTPNTQSLYDVSTVTLAQLAARVKGIQDALATHGMILEDI